jgi:hypothetical protein
VSRSPFNVRVRVTRTRKCKEGFYILINGVRLHHLTRRSAIENLQSFLELQRFQIVTVREYARRKSVRSKIPKGGAYA